MVGPIPLVAIIVVDLLIAAGVLLFIVSRRSDDAVDIDPVTIPDITLTSSTREQIGTAATAPPAPQAQPIGTPFTYVDDVYRVEWTGVVSALVELEPTTGDGSTRCIGMVGSLTPSTTVGAFASSSYTPRLRLVADGHLIDDTINVCDDEPLTEAGYGWILDIAVTAGTSYPFFAVFELEADADLEAALVSAATAADQASWFSPDISASVPPPPAGTIGPIDEEFLSVGTTVGYTPTLDDAYWDLTIDGMVETGVQYADPAGRCYLIVGTLVPSSGPISDPTTTPRVGLSVDGRFVRHTASDCDSTAAEDAGYGWILSAEVTPGTEYRFWAEVYVPPGLTEIQGIVAGNLTLGGDYWFEPVVLPSL